MVMKVISTGSQDGNCYSLCSESGEILLLDCGCSYKDILRGINYRISNVVGCLVSHEHKDHSKSVKDLERIGIPVFKPYENFKSVVQMGSFTVNPFELVHDVPCYGFYITQSESGKIVYLTDTEFCRFRFQKVNHIMVEANYDKRLISDDFAVRDRVLQSHLELQTTKRFLQANMSNHLRNIVLIHMSQSNMDYDVMEREIKEVSGKAVVSIAVPGLEVNMNRVPF